MADKLDTYRRKRDFSATPEPQGGRARGGALSYVIQKHAARSLHYDFRLELDGTLVSWAIPKGPSLDPADKRMAVHVEDHPLDYAGFEGTIPAGHYGAGTVVVWDRGRWIPDEDPKRGLRAGKLKFELQGEKLHGHWTLVRMHGRAAERQEPWLLIKERDEAARPAAEYSVVDEEPGSVLDGRVRPAAKPARAKKAKAGVRPQAPQDNAPAPGVPAQAVEARLPLTLAPQLATLVDRPPPGDWIYELKFDGYRLVARVDGGEVRLFTRNGHDWTSKLRSLAQEIRAMQLPEAWLDGEIVVPGRGGAPDFQLLQNAFDASDTGTIQYYVFDLPHLAGHDLCQVPLKQRRELLQQLLQAHPGERVRFSESFDALPQNLLHEACELRMEGVIGKRADAPYVSGRSATWIKLKCTQRQEFVIGGWTDPNGSRSGLGSLMLGVHNAQGVLHYAGNVGTGFDQRTLADLVSRLAPLGTGRSPFADAGKERGHWVKPKLVAEISFAGWTREGRLRQAVFHGLRSDKPAAAIVREQPVPAKEAAQRADAEEAAMHATPSRSKTTAARKAAARPPATEAAPATSRLPAGLKLTHPERVIDASTGLTKLDLARYYAEAAPLILPHLQRRPVSLVRGPDGIGGELFFQKHAQGMKIPGVKLLPAELDRDHDPLLEVATGNALMGCVQMNVIEFHTWNATTRAIEKPDRMTFDLDPGEGVQWKQVQEGAQLVRALLQELGLQGFLKTSGGKGLHVVVPLVPKLGWDEVKDVSRAVVEHLATTLPDRFVAKSGPKNRVGRIFVDYLRNGRGATTAAAWTVRARPGMGVSVPVDWDEMGELTSGAHWTLASVRERFEVGDRGWAGYGEARQTLAGAIKALDILPAARRR